MTGRADHVAKTNNILFWSFLRLYLIGAKIIKIINNSEYEKKDKFIEKYGNTHNKLNPYKNFHGYFVSFLHPNDFFGFKNLNDNICGSENADAIKEKEKEALAKYIKEYFKKQNIENVNYTLEYDDFKKDIIYMDTGDGNDIFNSKDFQEFVNQKVGEELKSFVINMIKNQEFFLDNCDYKSREEFMQALKDKDLNLSSSSTEADIDNEDGKKQKMFLWL